MRFEIDFLFIEQRYFENFKLESCDGRNYCSGEGILVFEWVLKVLKADHENIKINCFMSDKLPSKLKGLNLIFPRILLYLCYFHTIQTFDREITKYNLINSKKVLFKNMLS